MDVQLFNFLFARTSVGRVTPTLSPDAPENTHSQGISAYRIGPGLGSIVKCRKPTAVIRNHSDVPPFCTQDPHCNDPHDPCELTAISEFLDDGK